MCDVLTVLRSQVARCLLFIACIYCLAHGAPRDEVVPEEAASLEFLQMSTNAPVSREHAERVFAMIKDHNTNKISFPDLARVTEGIGQHIGNVSAHQFSTLERQSSRTKRTLEGTKETTDNSSR